MTRLVAQLVERDDALLAVNRHRASQIDTVEAATHAIAEKKLAALGRGYSPAEYVVAFEDAEREAQNVALAEDRQSGHTVRSEVMYGDFRATGLDLNGVYS